MRGLKLFGFSALAANRGALEKRLDGLKSVGKPMTVEEPVFGRRQAMQAILLGTAAACAPSVSFALDMDAFMNDQLKADLKNCDPKTDPKCVPKLNADEALCKYGQSGGNARSDACKRVREAKEKSLGGASAK